MSYCPECGAEIDGGAKFCQNCGARVFSRSSLRGLKPSEKSQENLGETGAVSRTDNLQVSSKRAIPEGRPRPRKGNVRASRVLVGVMALVFVAFLIYMIPIMDGTKLTTTQTTTQFSSTSTSSTIQSTTQPVVLGVLEGATNYVGTYPAAANVNYIDSSGREMSVLAYPGQIQVFFDPAATYEDAGKIIKSNGGVIIGAIPQVGYYLVQISVGLESSFISSILTHSQVIDAMPNLALEQEQDGVYISEDYFTTSKPVPLNVHGPVAVDSGQHGRDVVGTAAANGGEITDIVNITGLDGRTPGDKWILALNAIAQGNAIFNPGTTTYINISQGAGYRDDARSGDTNGNGELGDWSDWSNLPPELQQEAINNRIAFMSNVLRGIESLPYDLYNDTFITMSGGNNGMPLESVLAALRSNAGWEALLRDTIAIATCPTSLYGQANQGQPGDPSVVVMTNPQAAYGTSFAAPAANAVIQKLTRSEIVKIMNDTGASFAQIVQAAGMARDANASGRVVASEVQAMVGVVMNSVGNLEGSWSGSYSASHTESTDGWVRQSGGAMSWEISGSNGTFQGSLFLDGIQVL
ncbi:MAG: zinc ribbon domain-containing protein, partial [Candidatus Hadarchaeum sp.]